MKKEALKFFDEVIVPYLDSERKRLNLPNQYGLVVMDDLKGQMTDKVIGFLHDNSVLHEKIPANMTHHFQPLDLTVNGAAKHFMKQKFMDWYAKQVILSLEKGTSIEEIDVELKNIHYESPSCILDRFIIQPYDVSSREVNCGKWMATYWNSRCSFKRE